MKNQRDNIVYKVRSIKANSDITNSMFVESFSRYYSNYETISSLSKKWMNTMETITIVQSILNFGRRSMFTRRIEDRIKSIREKVHENDNFASTN